MATDRDPYPDNPDDTLAWVRITADAVVFSGPCLFWGVAVNGDAVAIATVDIFDGANNTGRRHGRFQASITTILEAMLLPKPVRFDVGIFVGVSGAGFQEATVYFQALSPYPVPR